MTSKAPDIFQLTHQEIFPRLFYDTEEQGPSKVRHNKVFLT